MLDRLDPKPLEFGNMILYFLETLAGTALPFRYRSPLSGARDMAAKKDICLSPRGN